MEIWKNIEGYEGKYQVSNTGKVKSLNYGRTGKEKVLKVKKRKDGYLEVNLHKDRKQSSYRVHGLVAKAFLPNTLNLPEINHKDEDKENNCVDNLEWCTPKYNCNYGNRIDRIAKKCINGINSKPVICVETNIVYPSIREVQRVLGYKQSNLTLCCQGKIKTCGGFHWEYAS